MTTRTFHLIANTIAVSLALTATSASAQNKVKSSTTAVLPFTGPNLNDVVLDSQLVAPGSNNDVTTLDMYVNCFGTNLRAVANPISETSSIKATLNYLTAAGNKRRLDITFPATVTMAKKSNGNPMDMNPTIMTNQTVVDGNSNSHLKAVRTGNLIRIELTGAKTIPVDVLAEGPDFSSLPSLDVKSTFLSDISFSQTVPSNTAPQQFMAFSGPITASHNWYVSENGKSITMLASFPGENRFCGGYFSPLALSFTEKTPVVDKKSKFNLFSEKIDPKKGGAAISWPSFKEEIYFLAVDHNKNGKIDDGSELFGDINGYPDGFKNLAAFDSNQDGVIDEKDEVFSQLVLWRDKNHDGKSSTGEIKTLKSMGIESISLQFENASQDLGNTARLLGPGSFSYKDKKGEVRKGRVWDIFLKKVP